MSVEQPPPTPPDQPGAPPAAIDPPTRRITYSRRKVRTGLTLTLAGFVVFVIGASPSSFGLDRSLLIGFVQIAVFLVGLAIMCIGGYTCMTALWKDRRFSISADIGVRMVATGYVVAVFTGMADIFGLGSHRLPNVPYFGPWQARGVEIGQAIIAIGFLLLIPHKLHDTPPADEHEA